MPPRKSTKRKHDIVEAEGSVNEQILTVLRSIDARLGRIERQGQQLGGRQPLSRLRDASSTTTSIVTGSWKFKTNTKYSFVKVDEEGLVLIGYHFNNPLGSHPARHHNQSLTSFDSMAPKWVNDSNSSGTRNVLAQLVFNDKAELNHKSGIYTLTIKYNVLSRSSNQDAAIIIGEMEFHSSGYALAEGADWDRLLNNYRPTQLPYSRGARGVATWQIRKISEQWVDGDELKFKIDTNENTIVFQKGNTPAKTFWNVLAFTNNVKYPEYLRAFAYCGATDGTKEIDVKLTITP